MKKVQLIESVQSFFANDVISDEKQNFHPEDIKVALNFVFNKIIYEVYLNGRKYNDLSQLDVLCKYYECDVVDDYALLPFPPVQLLDGQGIREVRDHDSPGNVFVPVEATSNPIFAELEVSTMDSTPTYHVEQSDVAEGEGEKSHLLRLQGMPTGDDAIESVDVLMVTPFDQIGSYEDIVIPGAGEDVLIQQTINFLINKPAPQDKGNDFLTPNNQSQ